MSGMNFLPGLRDFLIRKGTIYTVRKYSYDFTESDVIVRKVGKCHRTPISIITCENDLLPYAEFSGFPTVKDWWRKIEYFIPDKADTKYLYKVVVLTGQERHSVIV